MTPQILIPRPNPRVLYVGLTTTASVGFEVGISPPKPDGRYKKQESIDAWYQAEYPKRLAEVGEEAGFCPLTGQLKDLTVMVPSAQRVFDTSEGDNLSELSTFFKECGWDSFKPDNLPMIVSFLPDSAKSLIWKTLLEQGFQVGIEFALDTPTLDPRRILLLGALPSFRDLVTGYKFALAAGIEPVRIPGNYEPGNNAQFDSQVLAGLVSKYKMLPSPPPTPRHAPARRPSGRRRGDSAPAASTTDEQPAATVSSRVRVSDRTGE